MRLLVWLLRALTFIALFAFASNNQHEVQVNGPFGLHWQGRMIFVVLAAFALGTIVGAIALLPWRWRQRQPPVAPGPAAPDAGSPRTMPAASAATGSAAGAPVASSSPVPGGRGAPSTGPSAAANGSPVAPPQTDDGPDAHQTAQIAAARST